VRAKVPRRRAVEIARTRDDILIAAARALGRRGFGSVSMQEIAAEVGFTAPALYAYFASKDEIFSELQSMLQRELADTFQPPPPAGQSFRRRLSILLGRQLEWADRRRDVFLAFFALRARGGGLPPLRAGADAELPPIGHMRAMGRWMRQASERPVDLGGRDPEEAACLLFGICHGFFLRWLLLPGAHGRLADETERILDLFFHGVLGAPPDPPRPNGGRGSARRPRRTSNSSS
jgi:AcrR family transcriptional regulator